MTTSNKQADNGRRNRGWLRRGHRWLGIGLALFVLLLSCTGIALNHSGDWNLGGRYLSWSWLLNAYGIEAPAPYASFSDRGHYAALLGQRLYFDQHEIAEGVEVLTGVIVTGELALVTTDHVAYVLTINGDLVEHLDLSQFLSVAIEKAGRLNDRVVIASTESRYRSDTGITHFELWSEPYDDVAWSQASPLPTARLTLLQDQYRGRGLSVERLLIDIHSGRFVGRVGPMFMDLVALLLIVLSATGLLLWIRRSGRKNGANGNGN